MMGWLWWGVKAILIALVSLTLLGDIVAGTPTDSPCPAVYDQWEAC